MVGWMERTCDLTLLNELPCHDFLRDSSLSSYLHVLLSETTFWCFWCSLQPTLPQPMGHGTAAIVRGAGTMNVALSSGSVRKRT